MGRARNLLFLLFFAGSQVVCLPTRASEPDTGASPLHPTIELPKPHTRGGCSLEKTLAARHSVREFTDEGLTLEQVGQLLWAAQGITHGEGYRTAPSAGALYPLELYLLVGRVQGLEPGEYHYRPQDHTLIRLGKEDSRPAVAQAALGQPWVKNNAAVLVFAAKEQRTAAKYGQRAGRYVAIEVGHAAQNVALQATALGLGAAVVGAFDERDLAHVLHLPPGEEPLYLMALGVPLNPLRCGTDDN